MTSFIGAPLKKRHAIECMGIDSDAAISCRLVYLYRRITLEGSIPGLSVLRGRGGAKQLDGLTNMKDAAHRADEFSILEVRRLGKFGDGAPARLM